VRLHDEYVTAPDALAESWPDLAVGKLNDVGFAERDIEVSRYLTCEFWMGPTAVEHHPLGGDFVDRFVHCEPS